MRSGDASLRLERGYARARCPSRRSSTRAGRPRRDARALFLEYASELGIDLSFQGFDQRGRGAPGRVRPAPGRLLLALDHQEAGCVALRLRSADTCEMKRLYVRDPYRGTGLGRRLAQAIVVEARASATTHAPRHAAFDGPGALALPSLGFRDRAVLREPGRRHALPRAPPVAAEPRVQVGRDGQNPAYCPT